MKIDPAILADTDDRFIKFQQLFIVQDVIDYEINRILNADKDKLILRGGEEHLLSLVMATAFGKALKTFRAIARLCRLGFGEDALILLRSNVNLLINVTYILSDKHPAERTKDFYAFSYQSYVRFLKEAYNEDHENRPFPMPKEELKQRANNWKKLSILDRVKPESHVHYHTGYRFYSAFEHSDMTSLFSYVNFSDSANPTFYAGPSDQYIREALSHNYGVAFDFFITFCKYQGISRPDIITKLENIWMGIVVPMSRELDS